MALGGLGNDGGHSADSRAGREASAEECPGGPATGSILLPPRPSKVPQAADGSEDG
jgi:hypothetical protein